MGGNDDTLCTKADGVSQFFRIFPIEIAVWGITDPFCGQSMTRHIKIMMFP